MKNLTQQQAMDEAVRKARRSSPHDRRIGLHVPADQGTGFGEMTERREAARLGSARLLDRINALRERGQ